MASLPLDDLEAILMQTESLWADARGARFFITGGSGFVGRWLTESLLHANRRLNLGVSAVLLTRDALRFQTNAPHIAEDSCVTLVQGSAESFEFPRNDCQFALHVATERHFAASADHRTSTFDRDLTATRRVLDLARLRGVKRFLFTSSGAVYGRQPAAMTHLSEDYSGAPATTDIHSAYGQAKRASEFLCSAWGSAYGFDAMIARLFAFSGPLLPLDENYAIGNFIRDAMKGGPVQIGGDGTPCRSYLYAGDLAIWLWTILFSGTPAFPYNVGASNTVTISDLAKRVTAVIAPAAEIQTAKQAVPGAPPARYVPATDRCREGLGLRELVTLDEGIRRTHQWLLGSKTARN